MECTSCSIRFLRSRQVCLSAGLALLLWLLRPLPWAFAQQAMPSAVLRARAQDGANNPIPDVLIQVTFGKVIAASASTNDQGEVELPKLAPGNYEVAASKEGYETLRQSSVVLTSERPVEIEFTLVPKVELKDSIDVVATPDNPVEQGASVPVEIQHTQIQKLPNKPATVADVLPLLPGIIRTPDDEIRISGSSEHRSAFIVNSTDVTDPATGRFGVSVPVDSVETLNVFKTPYLAQYGRFTAGVVSVETRRGGEKWGFEFNDPLPEFRFRSGHLVGIRDASPRITFNGPLIKNRFYLSQGLEYALHKVPSRTLSYPYNESRQESANSFTQLDYILSPTHLLTGTFHLAPRRTNYVNLEFFNPQPVTPSFSARDYTGTVIDRLTIGSHVLESLVAVKRYGADVWAQGPEEMVLTPTGNQGNYFSEQEDRASRVEWLESLSLKPLDHIGTHHLKFGSTVTRTANRGEFLGRPVNIQDTDGHLLKRIEFVDGSPFDRSDVEVGFFGQDHWLISPRVAMDMGLRIERQGITETVRIAPRVGLAWTPFSSQQTVLRGGFGLFYDRVPLSVYAFGRYPEQVITTYGPNGEIIDGPRRFLNLTDQAEHSGSPFILRRDVAGNFAPYSATWNVEVEHALFHFLRIRANYLQSNSSGVVLVTPAQVQGHDALRENGDGRARYRQMELTARLSWKSGQEILFSYVRSRSRGDLNEFNKYLGNFPFPLVRPNQFTNLPGDTPHRFLTWGVLNFPWKLSVGPLVEYHTGFPFAVLDSAQNYVGTPNSDQTRFPHFFSFDTRVSKDFKVNGKYTLRFSVRGLNLTNHFNPLGVHANIGDPDFGVFFGHYKRRYLVDFDILY
jgi:Carboxypeptidase regulatory-like domain